MIQGTVQSVEMVSLGSELMADAAPGATVLQLGDPADFWLGTRLQVAGAIYAYDPTLIDDDAATVTLATGLTVAAASGSSVLVWDETANLPAVRVEATVIPESPEGGLGDPLKAAVTPGAVPFLPIGPRDPENAADAENVTLEEDANGILWLTKVNARAAVLSADITKPLTDAIEAAQTSADGKNRIYYGSSAPTGGTYIVGDTWFDTANGNRINKWDGAAWVVQALGTNAIANLAITNALLAANIDAGKITAGTLNAITLTGNTISGGTITGSIIRTAATGNRVELNGSAAIDRITLYSGDAAEVTPGRLQVTAGAGNLYTHLYGVTTSGGGTPTLSLGSLASGGPSTAELEGQYASLTTPSGLSKVSADVTGVTISTGGLPITLDSSGTNFGLSATNTNINAASSTVTLSGALYVCTGGTTSSDALRVEAGGNVVIPRHGTTTSAASVFMGTGGTFFRVTSKRDTKLAIETFEPARLKSLLDLDVRTWFDKTAAEAHAAYLAGEAEIADGASLTRIPGLVAEEVEETGLKEFVTYDDTGEIQGLAYDRIGVAWIPLVRELFSRIEALEAA